MPTQELRLTTTPATLLAAGDWRRPFVLDGSGCQSWGSGVAVFGHAPRATLRIAASGAAECVVQGVPKRMSADPLVLLQRFWEENVARRIDDPGGPFAGGLIAALSYDLKHFVERLPDRARDDQSLPVLECGWYDWALLFDHRARAWRLTSSFLNEDELQAVGRTIAEAACRPREAVPFVPLRVSSNFTRPGYVAAVRRALEYIAAGDIYQVNLAQRFAAALPPSSATATSLFVELQRRHPMPFGAYLDCDDFVVVSNSPECFLRLMPESIATFPIKGTGPRGDDPDSDAAHAEALRLSPKDAAEHVMIVDLERNDLGRVCEPGSVAVGSFASVQSYPTLHHLVSEVHGRLRRGASLREILRATFPGGSITGAPKIRAMEIIDELEPVRRGFYTGAIGFVDAGGTGMFNIAIRTAIAGAGRLTYHAGGAIVADSDPDAEYEETLLKARAFLEACGASGAEDRLRHG